VKFQRSDGKELEIDVMAESDCGRVIMVEVKKTKKRISLDILKDFQEKLDSYKTQTSKPYKIILPGFLSVGGFTENAMEFCKINGIGTAERIEYFLS